MGFEDGADDEYGISEFEVCRIAERCAGRYVNRLIWEWCKQADREGLLVIDLSKCASTILQRACHIQALQEIRREGMFTVTRKREDLFIIRA